MEPIFKRKDKQKSNTLKKVEKKVFNEDLVEIGEPTTVGSKEPGNNVIVMSSENTN
jgi:hypothetical protein